MEHSMQKLGHLIKERRNERNLSLKEVENATSIRNNYLQAIEEGNLYDLISPVYAQGFIKQYARFLELDGEGMIKEYAQKSKQLNPDHDFAYGLGTLEVRGSSPSESIKNISLFKWIGIGAIIITAAWLFARLLGVL